MKRVSFICQYMAKGGAERVISVLANYFVQNGYPVRIVLLYENIIDYELDKNIEILPLNWNRKMSISMRIKKWKELSKILNSNDANISFLYSAIRDTLISAQIAGIKNVIVSERNDPQNDPPGKLRQLLRTFLYFFAGKVVFQTNDAKMYFPKSIQEKGVIIANPIETNLPEVYKGERRKVIVAVGRLTSQKNLKMAINAFYGFHNQHSEYCFEIYGDGELKNDIQAYIDQMDLTESIKLMGFQKNVHDYIRDVAMYISSADYEGISNSMLEAMAIGLPCICTDCPVGGAREVIENGKSGILIPVGNDKELEKAMCKVAESKEFANTLSANALLVKEKFSPKHICSEWEKIIN